MAKTNVDIDTDMRWQRMVQRTGKPFADGGAYSSDVYADWAGCAALLRELGMTLANAETFLRSLHMRWCADSSDAPHGEVPVSDLRDYVARCPRYLADFGVVVLEPPKPAEPAISATLRADIERVIAGIKAELPATDTTQNMIAKLESLL